MRETKPLFSLYTCYALILITSPPFLSGSEKPPAVEMEQAIQAIAEAKQNEADLYVEDTFKMAEAALQRAQNLINEKEYQDAKTAADEATRLAKRARSMVESNKATMKENTE